jgi:hypothetical protein
MICSFASRGGCDAARRGIALTGIGNSYHSIHQEAMLTSTSSRSHSVMHVSAASGRSDPSNIIRPKEGFMRINDATQSTTPRVDRGYVVSMVISSFKGYKDVEVHLFRPDWEKEEERVYDWGSLLGEPIRQDQTIDPTGSRKVLMETFNAQEKDQLLEYLSNRYESRLESISARALSFPIPIGLVPLSEVPEQGTLGKIHFDKIPSYNLDFPVHGLYDLSRHVEETAHPNL